MLTKLENFIVADKEKTPAADDSKIDHYVKMGTIAMGKHAMVLEVQEENTANRFAMKLLLPEAMLDPEQVGILKYEGKVAQSLDHPNIIKWVATVHRKTNIYLILELFKALNIKSSLLNDMVGLQSRMRKFIDCTSLALLHMHEKGWVHLDVKPDNILMSRSYSEWSPIQNQSKPASVSIANVRCCSPMRADRNLPTLLKCSEGCEGSSWSNAKFLSANS